MNVLIVAAHPDDEVLGVGGTLAKHVQAGDQVHILLMADGETSRDGGHQIEARKQAAQDCAKVLGAKTTQCLNLPDNQMDTIPLLDIVKKIEHAIDQIKPNIVYTHHPNDLNIDHDITSRAVVTACRPVWPFTISKILAFETLSCTEWSDAYSGNAFTPDYFVDVTGSWSVKCAALECYKSELRAFPHPRSYEALEALATYRGVQVGCKKAEAFKTLRIID